MKHRQLNGTRIAAIDIGSNAVRLLVSRVVVVNDEASLKTDMLTRMPLRLGGDVFGGGTLLPETAAALIKTMCGFHYLTAVLQPTAMRAVATAAMREAANGDAVAAAIYRESAIPVDIIDGYEEAKLLCGNDAGDAGVLLSADVGGGSTDMALVQDGKILYLESFRLGTIRGDAGGERWRLCDWLEKIRKVYPELMIVGSGGNVSKIASLIGVGRVIKKDRLVELLGRLKKMSAAERVDKFNMRYDRSDTVIPAAEFFLTILQATNRNELAARRKGLADAVAKHLFLTLSEKTNEDG